jgi:predicted transcriptional regulator
MEVHLTPDLEKKLHELASQTGRGADELAQDAIAGFVDAVGEVRGMLNRRYDDLKSGRVRPIDGDEAFRRLRQRSESRRG